MNPIQQPNIAIRALRGFLALAALGLGLWVNSASANLIFYEPFATGGTPSAGEYTTGAITGQGPTVSGFTGNWVNSPYRAGSAQVVATGLSYSGLPTSGGAYYTPLNGGQNANCETYRVLSTPFTATTGGTYYMSFLMKLSATGSGRCGFELFNGGMEDGKQTLRLIDNNSGNFVIQKPNGGATTSLGARDTNVNLWVIKFTMVSGGNDTVTVYKNPSPLTSEPGTATATINGFECDFDRLNGVNFSNNVTLDEIRLGTTWSDVTLSVNPPTQLAYSAVPSTGVAGTPFSVTVLAQDAGGVAANVTSDTTITLTRGASGTGSLGGTTTGIITNGNNSVTISGVVYDTADTMTLTATATSGMTGLTAVTSGNIVFVLPPSKLAFTSVPANGMVGSPFDVTVQAQNVNGQAAPVTSDTTITLTRASGTGSLSGGTTTGTILNGTSSVTLPGVVYDTAETMTLMATASGGTPALTAVTSDSIVIGSALVKTVTGTTQNPITTWTSGNGTTVSDTWTVPAGVYAVKVLVVGGGGGGSMDADAGGGAGGLIYYGDETPANGHAEGTSYIVTPGEVLAVQVGAGGRGLTLADYFNRANLSTYQSALHGSDSKFGPSLTATGGGAGRRGDCVTPATASGGSGGGDRGNPPAGTAVSGQGFVGAYNSGGGGGAGGAGTSTGRSGGVGLEYSISGTATWYAGGGGGGSSGGGANWGAGGSGGGGDGGHNNTTDKTGYNGVNGTGGGGGGGGGNGGDGSGGHGGSGVVIVSYTAAAPPTQLAYYAVPTSGVAGIPFSVTVQAQDATGTPSGVTSDTTITLTRGASGGGLLGGTTTGTILNGTSSVTISGVTYSAADTMTLTATASGGTPALTAVTSGNIVFVLPPSKLAFTSVPASGMVGSPFNVTVQAQDTLNNPALVTSDTTITLTVASGTGSLSGGTTTGTMLKDTSSVTLSGVVYDTAEMMTLTATASGGAPALTAVTSGPIVIAPALVKTVAGTAENPIITWTSGNGTTVSDTWTVPPGVTSVKVLVVGGGGGGSMDGDPGGGAGGLLYYGPETPANGHAEGNTYVVTPGAELTVQVGAGGRGLTLYDYFHQSELIQAELHGADSLFGSLTATGGGAGRRGDCVTPATASGGSGGGDRADPPAGTALSGQGFVGGNNSGGGGGAGGAGNPSGRDGGVGLEYSISGTPLWYAGGGGGGAGGGAYGVGGSGVGGDGGHDNDGDKTGHNGVDGTGSGGGGGGGRPGDGSGGHGGSGVVILTYTAVPATPFDAWVSKPEFNVPSDQRGQADDPDGDGQNNLMEFALGGTPNNGALNAKVYSYSGIPSLTEYPQPEPAQKVLILTIAVRDGTADFTTASEANMTDGIRYTVEGGTTLNSWTGGIYPFKAASYPELPSLAGTGYHYQSFVLTGSEGLPDKGFLRIRVEPLP